MKKALVLFILIFSLIFANIATAAPSIYNPSSISELSNFTISGDFKDDNGNIKSASMKADVISIDGKLLIKYDDLWQFNVKAHNFVFNTTYMRAIGYMVISLGPGERKIALFVNKNDYGIINGDWDLIFKGQLSVAPIEYQDKAYVPIEFLDVLGYEVTSKDREIHFDLTKKKADKPVIVDVDRNDEVFIVKQNNELKKYKLIGVNLPDNDTIYNNYTSKYIEYLKGRTLDLKYDTSVGAVTYNENPRYDYVYAYIPNESISINEQILKIGYAYYQDFGVGNELNDKLVAAADYAKANEVGVYHKSNQDISNKTYNIKEVNDKIVTLTQDNNVYKVDFGDKELSSVIKDYVSLSLREINDKYIGKDIELKVQPSNNYEFVLYIITYLKEHR